MRRVSAVLLRSFLQGLILLSPIAVTAYLAFRIFSSIDSILPYDLLPYIPRGVGFLIVIVFVTMVGYLGTRFFIGRWLVNPKDRLGSLLMPRLLFGSFVARGCRMLDGLVVLLRSSRY